MKYPVAVAEILGQQAFVNGLPRIPSQDPKLDQLLNKLQLAVGEGIPIIEAWLRGWDNANLAGDRQ